MTPAPAAPPDERQSRLSWAGIGIALLVSLACLALFLRPEERIHQTWQLAAFHAMVRYQMSLENLRLQLARVHLARSPAEQSARQSDALTQRITLRGNLQSLVNTPALAQPLSASPFFARAMQQMVRLDERMDGLVQDALSSPQGLNRFEIEIAPAYEQSLTMVNDLRIAEIAALGSAYEAQGRAAKAYLLVSSALSTLIALGLFLHVRVTGRERAALRQAVEARAEAQRSAQARIALLGMVSHELRTPLQTIQGSIELLELELSDPSHRRTVERISSSLALISGQLDNISHYTRLANDRTPHKREKFDISQLLKQIVDEHADAAAAHNQQLSLHLPRPAWIVVEADQVRLHQIVSNYLANAIKYAGPVPISIVARTTRHAFAKGADTDAVEILVEDSGPGIPEPEQEAIWEPFVRGKRANGGRSGSGLGLAVVKLLAAPVGWHVGLRTVEGRGSTFFVTLPVNP